MRLFLRPPDDADLIRARLRALLAQDRPVDGWLPEDDEQEAAAYSSVQDHEPPAARSPAGLGRHRAPGLAVRLDPGRRAACALCAAALLASLLVVGWTWLHRPQVSAVPAVSPSSNAPPSAAAAGAGSIRRTAPSTPAVGEAATTSATVVVSVVGLVAHPGVVTLRTGARVGDAVAAAGGLLPQGAAASVNLAAVLTDGQQIVVGDVAAVAGSTPAVASAPPRPVSLNSATVAELDALPGVGPVLAQRIVDHRTKQGRFTAVDELADVPGIGTALYAQLTPLVRL